MRFGRKTNIEAGLRGNCFPRSTQTVVHPDATVQRFALPHPPYDPVVASAFAEPSSARAPRLAVAEDVDGVVARELRRSRSATPAAGRRRRDAPGGSHRRSYLAFCAMSVASAARGWLCGRASAAPEGARQDRQRLGGRLPLAQARELERLQREALAVGPPTLDDLVRMELRSGKAMAAMAAAPLCALIATAGPRPTKCGITRFTKLRPARARHTPFLGEGSKRAKQKYSTPRRNHFRR